MFKTRTKKSEVRISTEKDTAFWILCHKAKFDMFHVTVNHVLQLNDLVQVCDTDIKSIKRPKPQDFREVFAVRKRHLTESRRVWTKQTEFVAVLWCHVGTCRTMQTIHHNVWVASINYVLGKTRSQNRHNKCKRYWFVAQVVTFKLFGFAGNTQ